MMYAVIRDAGGLDVLVDNAGCGLTPTVTRAASSTLRLSRGRIVQVLASDGLALELAPGVHVTTIDLRVAPEETYASTLDANISGDAALSPEAWGDPNAVVNAVLAVVNAAQPPGRLAVGEPAAF